MATPPAENLEVGKMRELARGDGGAVMVMGTWMSLGLIGAAWYTVGLGDTLLYREKVQEAADSAAFSAAAVHAKGMNFIAMVNVVMLVLVGLWLILNIVEDILGVILDVTGAPVGNGLGGTLGCFTESYRVLNALPSLAGIPNVPIVGGLAGRGCCTVGGRNPWPAVLTGLGVNPCPVSDVVAPIEDQVRNARRRYADILGRTLPALSRVEGVVANVVTPAGGLAAGIVAGTQYNEATLAIGASMVPVPTIQFPLGFSTDGALGGLPLITQNFNRLCERTFNVTFDWIRSDVIGRIPGAGTLLGLPVVRQVIDVVQNAFAFAAANRYCNGERGGAAFSGFQDAGWRRVNPAVQNGSEQFQLWSFARSSYTDPRARLVNLGTTRATGDTSNAVASGAGTNTYFAQGEFYYDCRDDWGGDDCNNRDSAMFGLRWRARLKRVRRPQLGTALAGVLNGAIQRRLDSARDNGFLSPNRGTFGDELQNGAIRFVLGGAESPESVGAPPGTPGTRSVIRAAGQRFDGSGYSPGLIH